MNERSKQGKALLDGDGMIRQDGVGSFTVRSENECGKLYRVVRTGSGLECECDDHKKRGSDCKHIKAVLMFSCRNMGYHNESFRIMDRVKRGVCAYCDSGNVIKKGVRKNRTGTVNRLLCKDCGRKYSDNIGFRKMRYTPDVITRAIQSYFSKMSTRRIAHENAILGIKVSHMTVYNWVSRFSGLVADYLNDIVPRTTNRNMVRADEVYTKFSGQMHYLFASMDDDTRFWLAGEVADSKFQHDADNLLKMTRKKIGNRSPTHFTTDDLHAYKVSARRVFGPRTNHISGAALHSKRRNRLGDTTNAKYHPSNNKMERLNGEFRDWEQTRRGLKKPDTPLIPGFINYYNYAKPHGALNLKTPAEAALIEIEGDNKWVTMIQNAALHKLHN